MSVYKKETKVHYFERGVPKTRTFENTLEANLFMKFPPHYIKIVSWRHVSN